MILTKVARVDEADVSRYAWSRLRQFRNVSEVEDLIVRLHNPGRRHRSNAKKQATQLRHCLIQAQEYFDAAAAVSLATKPVLFYYCMMSLALAEVLLKQSGMSSLDRAREHNKHHGLTLRVQSASKELQTFREGTSSLVAVPLVHPNGKRFGTFDLWHRSCREMPMATTIRKYVPSGGSSTEFRSILGPADGRLPLVPTEGLSLFECMRNIPGMRGTVGLFGIQPNTLRARLGLAIHERSGKCEYDLIIHPASGEMIEEFFSNVLFHVADGLERITLKEMPSGGIVEWWHLREEDPIGVRVPNGTMWTTEEVRFWPCEQPLNEFGFIYVALYIVGNYARYFPDLWMRDVERSSPLAIAAEELLAMASTRMPLLTLSEMSRTYFVPSG